MSRESPAVFSCEDFEYGDSSRVDFFVSKSDSRGSIREIDRIRTRLTVAHPPNSQIHDYRWEDREIWFYTSHDNQYLEIEILSPQIWQEEPRFHLHKIHSNSLDHVSAVEHRLHGNDRWTILSDKSAPVPEHTRFIRLTLNLPGHGPRRSFKLSVYSRDRERLRDINCDPLVGNDPP
jgi:hypothetical protein